MSQCRTKSKVLKSHLAVQGSERELGEGGRALADSRCLTGLAGRLYLPKTKVPGFPKFHLD